jgi:ATP-dependent Clp protease protease subunit
MSIARLDEEEKPDTPPKAEERTSNPIDASLFKSRTVLLFGEINDKVARTVTAQLLALSAENAEPIRMFINSPGGHVESGDTIFDLIRFTRAPVRRRDGQGERHRHRGQGNHPHAPAAE